MNIEMDIVTAVTLFVMALIMAFGGMVTFYNILKLQQENQELRKDLRKTADTVEDNLMSNNSKYEE